MQTVILFISICFAQESVARCSNKIIHRSAGGADSYGKDAPLTRVGQMQAYLVGEGLRAARLPLRHLYASPSLRCVETAHNMLQGIAHSDTPPVECERVLLLEKINIL